MNTKDRIVRKAAVWFAEIGEIPSSYKGLQDKYPTGKPDAVLQRTWKKYFNTWGSFITKVQSAEKELCALALNPPQDEPVEESKDPLEALRASTVEK
jgi:hypothetical protein